MIHKVTSRFIFKTKVESLKVINLNQAVKILNFIHFRRFWTDVLNCKAGFFISAEQMFYKKSQQMLLLLR